jgi:hypothetical protein
MPKQTSGQRWRMPAVPRVKYLLQYLACAAIAAVFFPRWLGLPLGALLALWALGMAACGVSVRVDENAGRLTLRVGWIIRRVPLTQVTAVLVDTTKVTLKRSAGWEISFYAWRKGPLDALLRVPVVAGDIGHAISSAVALARAYAQEPAEGDPVAVDRAAGASRPAAPGKTAGGTPAATRSRLATALLAAAGALSVVGALLVRVHWGSPVLTVLGVVIALTLGVVGLLQLMIALWLLLTGRTPRIIASS